MWIIQSRLRYKFNECVHIHSHIKSLKDKAPTNIWNLSVMIRSKVLQTIYAYADDALGMFSCIQVTNCYSERSFSTLRRIKTHSRSVMNNDRLNALVVLNSESELSSNINYDNIVLTKCGITIQENNFMINLYFIIIGRFFSLPRCEKFLNMALIVVILYRYVVVAQTTVQLKSWHDNKKKKKQSYSQGSSQPPRPAIDFDVTLTQISKPSIIYPIVL